MSEHFAVSRGISHTQQHIALFDIFGRKVGLLALVGLTATEQTDHTT